jgi:hypothetical protein
MGTPSPTRRHIDNGTQTQLHQHRHQNTDTDYVFRPITDSLSNVKVLNQHSSRFCFQTSPLSYLNRFAGIGMAVALSVPFILLETQPEREKQVCLYVYFICPWIEIGDFHRINRFSWKFPLFLVVLHEHGQDGVVPQLLVAFITSGDVSRRNK